MEGQEGPPVASPVAHFETVSHVNCRLCARRFKKNIMKKITDPLFYDGWKKRMEFMNLEADVSESSQLPEYVCPPCSQTLRRCSRFDFRLQENLLNIDIYAGMPSVSRNVPGREQRLQCIADRYSLDMAQLMSPSHRPQRSVLTLAEAQSSSEPPPSPHDSGSDDNSYDSDEDSQPDEREQQNRDSNSDEDRGGDSGGDDNENQERPDGDNDNNNNHRENNDDSNEADNQRESSEINEDSEEEEEELCEQTDIEKPDKDNEKKPKKGNSGKKSNINVNIPLSNEDRLNHLNKANDLDELNVSKRGSDQQALKDPKEFNDPGKSNNLKRRHEQEEWNDSKRYKNSDATNNPRNLKDLRSPKQSKESTCSDTSSDSESSDDSEGNSDQESSDGDEMPNHPERVNSPGISNITKKSNNPGEAASSGRSGLESISNDPGMTDNPDRFHLREGMNNIKKQDNTDKCDDASTSNNPDKSSDSHSSDNPKNTNDPRNSYNDELSTGPSKDNGSGNTNNPEKSEDTESMNNAQRSSDNDGRSNDTSNNQKKLISAENANKTEIRINSKKSNNVIYICDPSKVQFADKFDKPGFNKIGFCNNIAKTITTTTHTNTPRPTNTNISNNPESLNPTERLNEQRNNNRESSNNSGGSNPPGRSNNAERSNNAQRSNNEERSNNPQRPNDNPNNSSSTSEIEEEDEELVRIRDMVLLNRIIELSAQLIEAERILAKYQKTLDKDKLNILMNVYLGPRFGVQPEHADSLRRLWISYHEREISQSSAREFEEFRNFLKQRVKHFSLPKNSANGNVPPNNPPNQSSSPSSGNVNQQRGNTENNCNLGNQGNNNNVQSNGNSSQGGTNQGSASRCTAAQNFTNQEVTHQGTQTNNNPPLFVDATPPAINSSRSNTSFLQDQPPPTRENFNGLRKTNQSTVSLENQKQRKEKVEKMEEDGDHPPHGEKVINLSKKQSKPSEDQSPSRPLENNQMQQGNIQNNQFLGNQVQLNRENYEESDDDTDSDEPTQYNNTPNIMHKYIPKQRPANQLHVGHDTINNAANVRNPLMNQGMIYQASPNLNPNRVYAGQRNMIPVANNQVNPQPVIVNQGNNNQNPLNLVHQNNQPMNNRQPVVQGGMFYANVNQDQDHQGEVNPNRQYYNQNPVNGGILMDDMPRYHRRNFTNQFDNNQQRFIDREIFLQKLRQNITDQYNFMRQGIINANRLREEVIYRQEATLYQQVIARRAAYNQANLNPGYAMNARDNLHPAGVNQGYFDNIGENQRVGNQMYMNQGNIDQEMLQQVRENPGQFAQVNINQANADVESDDDEEEEENPEQFAQVNINQDNVDQRSVEGNQQNPQQIVQVDLTQDNVDQESVEEEENPGQLQQVYMNQNNIDQWNAERNQVNPQQFLGVDLTQDNAEQESVEEENPRQFAQVNMNQENVDRGSVEQEPENQGQLAQVNLSQENIHQECVEKEQANPGQLEQVDTNKDNQNEVQVVNNENNAYNGGIIIRNYNKNLLKRQSQSERLRQRRRTENYSWNSYMWPCSHCESRHSSLGELRIHSQETHKLCHGYQCPDCNTDFNEFNNFVNHVRQHNPNLRYYCQYCNQRCTSEQQCQMHTKSHSSETQCRRCGETLPDADMLELHESAYYNRCAGTEYQICKFCGVMETSQDKGQALTLTNVQLTCLACDSVFTRFEKIKFHGNAVHGKCINIKCEDATQKVVTFHMSMDKKLVERELFSPQPEEKLSK